MPTVYLMALEHGAYYVGVSSDPEKELEAHREGLGPVWTQIHRPVRIVDVVEHVPASEVNEVVRNFMGVYGMDRVRGGSWEGVHLSDADRQVIRQTSARRCVVS